MFVETPSSGIAQVGTPNSGGRGSVTGGVLESSNVDLGTEFSNMIVTQRGFQANARSITTADTLLQETVNLVR
jgi:flagellar hook protein FlgE